jgi:hypothetical protein
MVCKDLQPISVVTSPFFRQAVFVANPDIKFPSRHKLREELLPDLLKTVDEGYVTPLLDRCHSVALTFDLWMSRRREDVFALVAHFIDPKDWKPQHLCLGMIKADHTDGAHLPRMLYKCLVKYKLLGKVIAYVKDGGANLNTCTNTLREILKKAEHTSQYAVPALQLDNPFSGTCFAHQLSSSLSKVLAKKAQGGGNTHRQKPGPN